MAGKIFGTGRVTLYQVVSWFEARVDQRVIKYSALGVEKHAVDALALFQMFDIIGHETLKELTSIWATDFDNGPATEHLSRALTVDFSAGSN